MLGKQRCLEGAHFPDQFRQLLYTGAASCVTNGSSFLAVSVCTPEYLAAHARSVITHLFDAEALAVFGDIELPTVDATANSCPGDWSFWLAVPQKPSIPPSPYSESALALGQPAAMVGPSVVLTSAGQALGSLAQAGAFLELSALTTVDQRLNWTDVLLPLRHKLCSAHYGRASMLPMDGSVLLLVYRRDVLAALGVQAPATWEELVDLVESYSNLTGSAAAPGAPSHAFCVAAGPSCDGLPLLEAIWHSIAQSMGLQQGVFFNPATLEPLVGTPAFTAAVEIFARLWRQALWQEAAEGARCGYDVPALRLGECAIAVGTFELVKDVASPALSATNSSDSGAAPAVDPSAFAVAQLPGSPYVLDPANSSRLLSCSEDLCPYADLVVPGAGSNGAATGASTAPPLDLAGGMRRHQRRLAQGTLVNRVPYVPNSQLVGGVSSRASASEQVLAWYTLSHLASPAGSLELVLTRGSNVAPYRQSHFAGGARELWAARGYDAALLSQGLDVQAAALGHKNLGWGMHIGDGEFYSSAVSGFLTRLLPPGGTAVPPASAIAREAQQLQTDLTAYYRSSSTIKEQYLSFLTLGADSSSPRAPPSSGPPIPSAPTDSPQTSGGSSSSGGGGQSGRRVQLGVAVTVAGLAVAVVAMCGVMYRRGFRLLFRRRPKQARSWTAPGVSPHTTLLITDIEGSTRLWEELPEEVMGCALRLHHACLRRCLSKHRGYESATEGDSFILAFYRPDAALAFAMEAQQELMDLDWPPELLATQACAPLYTCIPTGFPFKKAPTLETVFSRMTIRAYANLNNSNNSITHANANATPAATQQGPSCATPATTPHHQHSNSALARVTSFALGRNSPAQSPTPSACAHQRRSIDLGALGARSLTKASYPDSRDRSPVVTSQGMVAEPPGSSGSTLLANPVTAPVPNAAYVALPCSGAARPLEGRQAARAVGSGEALGADRRSEGDMQSVAIMAGELVLSAPEQGQGAPSVQQQQQQPDSDSRHGVVGPHPSLPPLRRPGELSRRLQELQDLQQLQQEQQEQRQQQDLHAVRQHPPVPPPAAPQNRPGQQPHQHPHPPYPHPHPHPHHPHQQQQLLRQGRLSHGPASVAVLPDKTSAPESSLSSSSTWAIIHGGDTAILLEDSGLTHLTHEPKPRLDLAAARADLADFVSAPTAVYPTGSTSRNPTGSGIGESAGAVNSGRTQNESETAGCSDSLPQVMLGERSSPAGTRDGHNNTHGGARDGDGAGGQGPSSQQAPLVPVASRSALAAPRPGTGTGMGGGGGDGEGMYGTCGTYGTYGTGGGAGVAWEVSTLEEALKAAVKAHEDGSYGKRRLLWRGLRVRMGLHSGVSSPSELAENRASARTVYSGDCASVVRAVSDSAQGGMVLLSEACLEALETLAASGSLHGAAADAILVNIGRYRIRYKGVATSLFLATSPELAPRVAMLPPPRNISPVGLSAYAAPVGRAAVAALNVPDLAALREWDPEATTLAVEYMDAILVEQLSVHRGYLVSKDWDQGCLTAAFAFPLDALRWALTCRDMLTNSVSWPPGILAHEACGEGVLPLGLPLGAQGATGHSPSPASGRWAAGPSTCGGAAAGPGGPNSALHGPSGSGPLPSPGSGPGPTRTSLELSHALTVSCDNTPAWSAAPCAGGAAAVPPTSYLVANYSSGPPARSSGTALDNGPLALPAASPHPSSSRAPMARAGSTPLDAERCVPAPLTQQGLTGLVGPACCAVASPPTEGPGTDGLSGTPSLRGASPTWRMNKLWATARSSKTRLRTALSQGRLLDRSGSGVPGGSAAGTAGIDSGTGSGTAPKGLATLGLKVAALSARLRGGAGAYMDSRAGSTQSGVALAPPPLPAAAAVPVASGSPVVMAGSGSVAQPRPPQPPASRGLSGMISGPEGTSGAEGLGSGPGSPKARPALTVRTGLAWAPSEELEAENEDGGDIFSAQLGGMDGFSGWGRLTGTSHSGAGGTFGGGTGEGERTSAVVVLRGPRIRVGIDCGTIDWSFSSSQHCLTYSGSPVSHAEKLSLLAASGQVLATTAVMLEMHRMQAALAAQAEPEEAAAGARDSDFRATDAAAAGYGGGGSLRGPAVLGVALCPASARAGMATGRHRRQQVFSCRFTLDWEEAFREHEILAAQFAGWASPRTSRLSPFSSPWNWSAAGRLRSKRQSSPAPPPPSAAGASFCGGGALGTAADSRRGINAARFSLDAFSPGSTPFVGLGGRASVPGQGPGLGFGQARAPSNARYAAYSGPCAIASSGPCALGPPSNPYTAAASASTGGAPGAVEAPLGSTNCVRSLGSVGPSSRVIAGAFGSTAQCEQPPQPLRPDPMSQSSGLGAGGAQLPQLDPVAGGTDSNSAKAVSASAPCNVLFSGLQGCRSGGPSGPQPTAGLHPPQPAPGLCGPAPPEVYLPPDPAISTASAAAAVQSRLQMQLKLQPWLEGSPPPGVGGSDRRRPTREDAMLGVGLRRAATCADGHGASLGGGSVFLHATSSAYTAIPNDTSALGTSIGSTAGAGAGGGGDEESYSLTLRHAINRAATTSMSRKRDLSLSVSRSNTAVELSPGLDRPDRQPTLAQIQEAPDSPRNALTPPPTLPPQPQPQSLAHPRVCLATPQPAFGQGTAPETGFASGVAGFLTPAVPMPTGAAGAAATPGSTPGARAPSYASMMALGLQRSGVTTSWATGMTSSSGAGCGGGGTGGGNSGGSGTSGKLQKALMQQRSAARRQQQREQALREVVRDLFLPAAAPAAAPGTANGRAMVAEGCEEGCEQDAGLIGRDVPRDSELVTERASAAAATGRRLDAAAAAAAAAAAERLRASWPHYANRSAEYNAAAQGAMLEKASAHAPSRSPATATAPSTAVEVVAHGANRSSPLTQPRPIPAPQRTLGRASPSDASPETQGNLNAWPIEIAAAAQHSYGGGGSDAVRAEGAVVAGDRMRGASSASDAMSGPLTAGGTCHHAQSGASSCKPAQNGGRAGCAAVEQRQNRGAGQAGLLYENSFAFHGVGRSRQRAASKARASNGPGATGNPGSRRDGDAVDHHQEVQSSTCNAVFASSASPYPAAGGSATRLAAVDSDFGGAFECRSRQGGSGPLLYRASTASKPSHGSSSGALAGRGGGGDSGWAGDSGGFAARVARSAGQVAFGGAPATSRGQPAGHARPALDSMTGDGSHAKPASGLPSATVAPNPAPGTAAACALAAAAAAAASGGSCGGNRHAIAGPTVDSGHAAWHVRPGPAAVGLASSASSSPPQLAASAATLRYSSTCDPESLDQSGASDEMEDSRATVCPPAGWRRGVHPPPPPPLPDGPAVVSPGYRGQHPGAASGAVSAASQSFLQVGSSNAQSDGAVTSAMGLAARASSTSAAGERDGRADSAGGGVAGASAASAGGRSGRAPRGGFSGISSSVCTLSLGRLHSASHHLDEPEVWMDEGYAESVSGRADRAARQG